MFYMNCLVILLMACSFAMGMAVEHFYKDIKAYLIDKKTRIYKR